MKKELFRILVRYTTSHRARLSRGWQAYGDKKPMPHDVAQLIATTLRARGADVQLAPIT